jgi:DNA-binding CsgD family transcriptional regulator
MKCPVCQKIHVHLNLDSKILLSELRRLSEAGLFKGQPFVLASSERMCSSGHGKASSERLVSGPRIELVSIRFLRALLTDRKHLAKGGFFRERPFSEIDHRRILVTEGAFEVPVEDLPSLSLYGWVTLANDGLSLLRCLFEVLEGRLWIPRSSLERHFPFHPHRHVKEEGIEMIHRSDQQHLANLLTQREKDAYRLMRAGLSNAEIADRLGVTVHTSKKHVHNVFQKLGLRKRRQAL